MDIKDILMQAVNHAAEGVIITKAGLDEPGEPEIIFVNDAMYHLTGYTREEMIGKTPRVLQGDHTNHEERTEMKNRLKAGESTTAVIENYRKDGSTYWVQLSIYPAKDEEGRLVGWIAIQKDVSREKELEDALDAQYLAAQAIHDQVVKLETKLRNVAQPD